MVDDALPILEERCAGYYYSEKINEPAEKDGKSWIFLNSGKAPKLAAKTFTPKIIDES